MTRVQIVMDQGATQEATFDDGRWRSKDSTLRNYLNSEYRLTLANESGYTPDKEALGVQDVLERFPGSIVLEHEEPVVPDEERVY